MELRSTVIKEKARQHAPGLAMDLIKRMVKEESDVTKQDIGRITEIQRQAILQNVKGHLEQQGGAQKRATMSM